MEEHFICSLVFWWSSFHWLVGVIVSWKWSDCCGSVAKPKPSNDADPYPLPLLGFLRNGVLSLKEIFVACQDTAQATRQSQKYFNLFFPQKTSTCARRTCNPLETLAEKKFDASAQRRYYMQVVWETEEYRKMKPKFNFRRARKPSMKIKTTLYGGPFSGKLVYLQPDRSTLTFSARGYKGYYSAGSWVDVD